VRYQRFASGRLQVRFESGDRIAESLVALLRAEQIGYAAATGLGALRWVRLSYWNRETREYETHDVDEQLELVSLTGNTAMRDGEPALHLHVALGRADLSVFGGHLNEAVAHPNVEIWLSPEPVPVERRVEPASGLPLMQLPETLER
jgi:uncharacterized protein